MPDKTHMKKIFFTIFLLNLFALLPLSAMAAASCVVQIDFTEQSDAPHFTGLALTDLWGDYQSMTYKFQYDSSFPSSLFIYDKTGKVIQQQSFASSRAIIADGDTPADSKMLETKSGVDELVVPSIANADHIIIKDPNGSQTFPVDPSVFDCSIPRSSITVAPLAQQYTAGDTAQLQWAFFRQPKQDTSGWLADANGSPLFLVSLWRDATKITDFANGTATTNIPVALPDYLSSGSYYVQVEVLGDSLTVGKSNVFTVLAVPIPTKPSGLNPGSINAQVFHALMQGKIQTLAKNHPSISPKPQSKPVTASPLPSPSMLATPSYSPAPSYLPSPSYSPAAIPVSTPPASSPAISSVSSPTPTPSIAPSIAPTPSSTPKPSSTPTPSSSPHAEAYDKSSFLASVESLWNNFVTLFVPTTSDILQKQISH